MVKINSIKELKKHSHKLPEEVALDIQYRMNDWIMSGGSYEDDYIKQQFRYAERIINSKEETQC
ncbi:DUF6877 family protein [Clostridium perfringens]|uniref:DUF6877 family protein n=1 Tax=Clostridium perfringens TaxID=1502 RepID=UPI0030D4E4F3